MTERNDYYRVLTVSTDIAETPCYAHVSDSACTRNAIYPETVIYVKVDLFNYFVQEADGV